MCAFDRVQRQMQQRPPQAWYWVARLRGSGRETGLLALMFDPGRESAEFGMMMPTWSQGSGYATEVVAALVTHAFGDDRSGAKGPRLQRLHTRHLLRHPAGPRVMGKLGFTSEATGREMVHWSLDRPR